MRWVLDSLAGIWNALLGRNRVPRDHDELWRHAEGAGAEVGGLEARNASASGGSAGLIEDAPTEAVIRGVVAARIASISQRLARRFNRISARAARWRRRGERRAGRAEVLRRARPDVQPAGRAIEPFVSRTLVYLATFGLVVLALESTGMWTSLVAYDGIIDDSFRIPMSIAAGAILTLAGHGMGHLLAGAVEERKLRSALLAGALAVFIIGVLTVLSLGAGRDANTRASDRFAQVGKLEGTAFRLEREAGDLREPTAEPLGDEVVLAPSQQDLDTAADMMRRAKRILREAAQVEAKARDERTLGFFAWIQILGLAVGTIGGYYFAGAAPVREYKRLTKKAGREDRRASRRFSRAERWQAKAEDMVAKVGRLVIEETAWGEADLGHFEEARLSARGIPAPPVAAGGSGLSEEELRGHIERAINPADLNGGGPTKVSDSKEE